ncbi:4-demethylwyosine synthase TYW1 [Vulcanisaeta thermophila]|uniref:4-demethylwyosine synthase TYW1 n=1 Tax=Vulcanisaeta thermophila TaxID=867917 RepID=UPI000853A90F|nr:4-demethylwyosine synthase TYW1 [Vulcanisaeta thermophila]
MEVVGGKAREGFKYHVISEINGRIRLRISEDAKSRLMRAGYGIFNHSTVELCHWTKSALTQGPSCYKFKFYGVPAGGSHRCVEFSPVGMICSNKCVYCWRPTDSFDSFIPNADYLDDPVELVQGILRERYRLLTGYFGNPKARERAKEALTPTHWAISLSGEPTMYPKLPELVKYLKSLPSTRSVFIVTNGQYPEMLERLEREGALPTQLYLSCNAPNRELFYRINVPVLNRDDAWERWLRSLELLSRLNTRTIIRITLIRSLNYDPKYIPEFARLMLIGNPHFIEVKSYMHLGHSTYRLSKSDMLYHREIREWALKLLEEINRLGGNFRFMDEDEQSRIVVLQNMSRYVDRWIVRPEDQPKLSEADVQKLSSALKSSM